jgi:hypothetical protein
MLNPPAENGSAQGSKIVSISKAGRRAIIVYSKDKSRNLKEYFKRDETVIELN